MKLKVNDMVQVMRGKAKGKSGKILKTDKASGKILVEKINMVVKHVKKTMAKPGEKITKESFMDASNVMVLCESCKKPTRVGYLMEKGKKTGRVCKKCNASLDTQEKK